MGGLVLGDLSHPTEALHCFFPLRGAPWVPLVPHGDNRWAMRVTLGSCAGAWEEGRRGEPILVVNQGFSSFPAGSKGEEERNEDKHVAEVDS